MDTLHSIHDTINIQIGNHIIGPGQPVFVIAEIGINHNGDFALAMQLIQVAKEAGAQAVKFQKRVVRESFTKQRLAEPYLTRNSYGKTYGEHKDHLEFSEQEFICLKEYCDDLKIICLATPCDLASADFLHHRLDLPAFKLASGDLTNLPLIRRVAGYGKPVIMSTGMSDLAMVKQAYATARAINPQIIVLSCTSSYPTPVEDIHLKCIETLRDELNHPNHDEPIIGYSGHEKGSIPTLGAVALGARLVERHFTMNCSMRGSDHAGSLEPEQFRQLVEDIRHLEAALGGHKKQVRPSEQPFVSKLSKVIVARHVLPMGTVLRPVLLTTKHGPSTSSNTSSGISPLYYDQLIGQRVCRSVQADQVISPQDLQLTADLVEVLLPTPPNC